MAEPHHNAGCPSAGHPETSHVTALVLGRLSPGRHIHQGAEFMGIVMLVRLLEMEIMDGEIDFRG
jgi:hypothetical protein